MTDKRNYLVLAGITHRLAVKRVRSAYVLEAWSPSSLSSPHTAEIVLSADDLKALLAFLQGGDA